MARKRKYTKEVLEEAIVGCKTLTELIEKFGLKNTGGNYRTFNTRLKEYNIDTSHFVGQSWSKGLTKETSDTILKQSKTNSTPFEEIFSLDSGYPTSHLLPKLLGLGWERRCNKCGIERWQGEDISIHVHHMNRDSSDNRLNNLCLVCPNCHSTKHHPQKKQIQYIKKKQFITRRKKKCSVCQVSISNHTKTGKCRSCASKARQQVKGKYPELEILQKMMWDTPSKELAKQFGVSDVALGKFCKRNNLTKPPRGYWTKNNS